MADRLETETFLNPPETGFDAVKQWKHSLFECWGGGEYCCENGVIGCFVPCVALYLSASRLPQPKRETQRSLEDYYLVPEIAGGVGLSDCLVGTTQCAGVVLGPVANGLGTIFHALVVTEVFLLSRKIQENFPPTQKDTECCLVVESICCTPCQITRIYNTMGGQRGFAKTAPASGPNTAPSTVNTFKP